MEWAVTPFPLTRLHGVHNDNTSLHFTSFYLTLSTATITQLLKRGLLWTVGTGDWYRSYAVPFMSYGIPINIHPIKRYSSKYAIKRYSWKYEVDSVIR